MGTSPQTDRTSGSSVFILTCALIGAALLCLHAFRYDFVADDTFIGLRYARNLLAGDGLVYNVGDQVEGYTTFSG